MGHNNLISLFLGSRSSDPWSRQWPVSGISYRASLPTQPRYQSPWNPHPEPFFFAKNNAYALQTLYGLLDGLFLAEFWELIRSFIDFLFQMIHNFLFFHTRGGSLFWLDAKIYSVALVMACWVYFEKLGAPCLVHWAKHCFAGVWPRESLLRQELGIVRSLLD